MSNKKDFELNENELDGVAGGRKVTPLGYCTQVDIKDKKLKSISQSEVSAILRSNPSADIYYSGDQFYIKK